MTATPPLGPCWLLILGYSGRSSAYREKLASLDKIVSLRFESFVEIITIAFLSLGVFTKRPSDKKRWEEEERGREMSCRRLVGGTSCGICPKGDVMAVPKVHLRPADILCWRPRRHGRAFLAPRRCHWHQCRPDLGMSPRRSAFLISWLMTRTLIRSLSQSYIVSLDRLPPWKSLCPSAIHPAGFAQHFRRHSIFLPYFADLFRLLPTPGQYFDDVFHCQV